ncbi:MAG: nuclear transport factor 2 family protein [Nanoarchaeota archaeon]
MSTCTPEIIAKKWLEAFNHHDLKDLLALYHEEAVHTSPKLRTLRPETKGQVKGKPALKEWWKDAFKRLPSLQYELDRLTANNSRVFIEYTRKVKGEPDMKVAELLEISKGLIVASYVYHG